MEYPAMSKVVIGCKMPSGFIIEMGSPGDPDYRSVNVKGANEGEIREGGLFVAHTVGGFGRTEVDAALWHAWKTGTGLVGVATYDPRTGAVLKTAKANEAELVASRRALVAEWMAKGLVFEVESVDLSLAQANEKAAVKTGFEPLAQAADPRAPRAVVKAA
jgi:hypothetical protein